MNGWMTDWLCEWANDRRTEWLTDGLHDWRTICKRNNAKSVTMMPRCYCWQPCPNQRSGCAHKLCNLQRSWSSKWKWKWKPEMKSSRAESFQRVCVLLLIAYVCVSVCVCVFNGGVLAWIVAVITNHKQRVAATTATTMQHRLKEGNEKQAWVRACLGPLLQFTVGCSCGLPATATAWAQLQQKVQGQHWNNPDFANVTDRESHTVATQSGEETASLRAR